MNKKVLGVLGVLVGFALLLPLAGMLGVMFLLSPTNFGCTQAGDISNNAFGIAAGDATLDEAIVTNANGNNRLAASMFLGAYMESRWNPSSVSTDGAFGAWQIQNPGAYPNPTITVEQALDPAYATNYMAPRYAAALGVVDPSLWEISPEQAAQSVAYEAERPAQTYYDAQGDFMVQQAFQATLTKMSSLGLSTSFSQSPEASTLGIMQPQAALNADITACGSGYETVDFVAFGPAVQGVIDEAKSLLGTPYVFGGGSLTGPTTSSQAQGNFGVAGFDCSSFTRYAFYNGASIELPRTAREQWRATQQYRVEPGQEQPGDLVFFGGYLGKANGPGHVGIVLDPSRQLMLAEPKTGDVAKIQSYDWGDDVMGFTRPYPSSPTE